MDTLRYKHRAPSHPDALLREVVLPELGITKVNLPTGWACLAAPCPRYCTNVGRLCLTWQSA